MVKYTTVEEIIQKFGKQLTWADIEKLGTFSKIIHTSRLKTQVKPAPSVSKANILMGGGDEMNEENVVGM